MISEWIITDYSSRLLRNCLYLSLFRTITRFYDCQEYWNIYNELACCMRTLQSFKVGRRVCHRETSRASTVEYKHTFYAVTGRRSPLRGHLQHVSGSAQRCPPSPWQQRSGPPPPAPSPPSSGSWRETLAWVKTWAWGKTSRDHSWWRKWGSCGGRER